jgi:hypothetical protein
MLRGWKVRLEAIGGRQPEDLPYPNNALVAVPDGDRTIHERTEHGWVEPCPPGYFVLTNAATPNV